MNCSPIVSEPSVAFVPELMSEVQPSSVIVPGILRGSHTNAHKHCIDICG